MDSDILSVFRNKAIRLVCLAESAEDAVRAFQMSRPFLAGCKFILAVPEGTAPGFAVNQALAGGFMVRSLFADSEVFFIDEHTVDEMQRGRAHIGFDHSIGLDNQIVSYMEPYLSGRAKVPDQYDQVFAYMARRDIDVHPMPYIRENYCRIRAGDPKDLDRIFSKMIAFETLKTLDIEHLERTREARSTLANDELVARSQEQFSGLIYESRTTLTGEHARFQHQCFYALLMKMACIQITSPRANPGWKIQSFLEFCHQEMAAMWMRETIIAQHYFHRGQELTFFGKVQKRQQKLFDVVRGMAWDLFHVRQLEAEMMMTPSGGARYFIPAFLTRDEGLIEVMDLCPLKAIALGETGRGPVPFFRGEGTAGTALESAEVEQAISNRYNSDAATSSRHLRNAEARRNLGATVARLERQLANAAEVAVP